MTATLFEEYVHAIDNKMAKKNRKVLFIVSNCPGHSKTENVEAVTVKFLLANMTSVLQLMDQGVIEVAQKIYRKSLLHRILFSYENGQGYDIDLLGAEHLLSNVWQQVRAVTIANCFAHIGFTRFSASGKLIVYQRQRQMTSQTMRNFVRRSSSLPGAVPPKVTRLFSSTRCARKMCR
ncbi:hypothetical protein HPB50_026099 [Hyalomma asiaticum]|uniref:Uncharacterized protein n=1 Tax=Hyalomma asiaticum TaxID=266040 RepID=A0ACB7TRH1_HYAAI|nr:hypothetical protein HPB50_026099 [Hyalomma asiaticum]